MKKVAFCLLSITAFSIMLFFLHGCYSKPVQPNTEIIASQTETVADEDEPSDAIVFPEFELPPPDKNLPVSNFREIWGYLVAGAEQGLNLNYPVTDLAYHGAEVNSYGKLVNVPNIKNISAFRGRKHIEVACNGGALTHFVLMEGSNERKALIRDLLEAAKPYDGLQIDFENVLSRDGEAFLSFLGELRAGLGNKIFSVALMGRIRANNEDIQSYYARIRPIVDRIFVMAYDEHWSGSAPGPIASMNWCQRVARYALDTIGAEKLVMGLPFYGRRWGTPTTNGALVYSTIDGIMRDQKITDVQRESGIPYFKYTIPVSVTLYYEDAYSLSARLDMYKKMGVNKVGFWRLGYETRAFWSVIGLEKTGP